MSVYQAVLNDDNVCVGLKQTKEKIDDDYHIEIDSMDNDYMWRKYDDGEWSDDKHKPESDNDTEELTLDDLKKQADDADIDQSEAILELYEMLKKDDD